MAENFLNLAKDNLSELKSTSRHIIVTLVKTKDKDKILKWPERDDALTIGEKQIEL